MAEIFRDEVVVLSLSIGWSFYFHFISYFIKNIPSPCFLEILPKFIHDLLILYLSLFLGPLKQLSYSGILRNFPGLPFPTGGGVKYHLSINNNK